MKFEQIIDKMERPPWRWFRLLQQAALLYRAGIRAFNALSREYELLINKTRKQQIEDAQRLQKLKDDIEQLTLTTSNELERLKLQHRIELIGLEHERATALDKQKLALLEIAMLREEREKLITERDQAVEGTTTLYEFIRRTRVTDSMGRKLPEMSVLNQRLRR